VTSRLEGKVAAISGSTRGIGRAVASAFLAEGAKVVVNSRDGVAAAGVARELGGDSVGVAADVTTEAGAAALVEGSLNAFGKLDIFVNNAGTVHAGDTLGMSLADWDSVIKLNMTAVFLCSREAARAMLGAGGGVIINTASVQAFAPFPRRLAYGSSKAAVVMMTRIMAAEWAPAVRVNAVAPGEIETAMLSPETAALLPRIPLNRLGVPADVAGTIFFLCSEDAAYVTGTEISVNGGQHILVVLHFLRAGRVPMLVPVMPRAQWFATFSPAPILVSPSPSPSGPRGTASPSPTAPSPAATSPSPTSTG